jgi:hypothetical protein
VRPIREKKENGLHPLNIRSGIDLESVTGAGTLAGGRLRATKGYETIGETRCVHPGRSA